MPGYYVHLAASNSIARKNRSFVCGIEAPDLLKKYFNLYGIDGAKEKYDTIKTNDMPDFSSFELRVQQKETNKNQDGLHYGTSSKPDILFFWNSLNSEQKKNPFYIGYLWHLLTDLIVYTYLDINGKFAEVMKKHSDDENLVELKKQEVHKLHADWDKTNARIRDMYSDVILPPEIVELQIVKFINNDQLSYVDWEVIKFVIDYMRSYNPLEQNVDVIIENIMALLENSKNNDIKDILKKKLVLNRRNV